MVAKKKRMMFKTVIEVEEPTEPMDVNDSVPENGSSEKRKRVSFGPVDVSCSKSGKPVILSDDAVDNKKTYQSILKRRTASKGTSGVVTSTRPTSVKNPKAKKKLQGAKKAGPASEGVAKAKASEVLSDEYKKSKISVHPNDVRREMKRHKLMRKLKKHPNYEVVIRAKKLWEIVRNMKKTPADREIKIEELYSLVQGKVKEFVFAHDAVRVVQCLMRLKREDIRTRLFEEVKDEIVLMSKSKYARFFVMKILKRGTPAQRDHVIKSFYGHVVDLMQHAIAADCVQFAYDQFANAVQRSLLTSEFYGQEFAKFKGTEVVTVSSVIDADPSKRQFILSNLQKGLISLTTKPSLRHSMVHFLLEEFFKLADDGQKAELIDSLKERVAEIATTRPGVFAAMQCIWFGNAKDRKTIVKTLKGLVAKFCVNPVAYPFILSIFDCVDDTVLVSKIVLKEIKTSLVDILNNKYGIKVVHYLLSPRDPHYFFPELRQLLAIGDGNVVSKKSVDIRKTELLEHISEPLIAHAAKTVRETLFDPQASFFPYSVMKNAKGDKSELFSAIAEVAADDFVPGNVEGYHLVEHPQGHFILKLMLRQEKDLGMTYEGVSLSQTIVERVPPEDLRSWIGCNKGCFILEALWDSGFPVVTETLASILSPAASQLKSYCFKGAKFLLDKISA